MRSIGEIGGTSEIIAQYSAMRTEVRSGTASFTGVNVALQDESLIVG